jgi:flavin-dependent dehydrogenase
VLVLEEKRMPRGKLCGEFITPECFPTLVRLGVMDGMIAAGAQKLVRVGLVVPSGKSVQALVSEMSDGANWAMSLSRATFDQILFERAREVGATCLEGVAVRGCGFDHGTGTVEALSLRKGTRVTFRAPVIVDASGRNSRLMVEKRERTAGRRGSRLYALKAHFKGIEGIGNQVELFFFPHGYGGLSRVEGGLFNLCFIVNEMSLRAGGGDPSRVVENTLMKNRLARERLQGAKLAGKWHSAGPLAFGRRRLARDGVIAIGDASGMIDPFTGTGIQIAIRTGEMAAQAILKAMGSAQPRPTEWPAAGRQRQARLVDSVLATYTRQYENEFYGRMRVAGLLRTAAFSPATENLIGSVLTRLPGLVGPLLRATRRGSGARRPPE